MIQLHHHPGNASFTPHVLLREIGVPFELVFVDRENGAHKRPEYLKLNANGTIPVLVDGPLVLYETASIALHLADRDPAAGLAPALQSDERAHFYKVHAVPLDAELRRAQGARLLAHCAMAATRAPTARSAGGLRGRRNVGTVLLAPAFMPRAHVLAIDLAGAPTESKQPALNQTCAFQGRPERTHPVRRQTRRPRIHQTGPAPPPNVPPA